MDRYLGIGSRRNAAILAAVAAFAIALYAYVVRLPFFRDDMVMLLWLREMSWGKLWVDATGFPYYRPLSFSSLKLSELVFGWPEPISLHVLNLALHAANSVLVAVLARRVWQGRAGQAAGLAAGLLYAGYPFSYEIMPTTGPIFQLEAAFFGLASALTYMRFRETRAARWLAASMMLALLGAFTCEYGAILPLYILFTEGMAWWNEKRAGSRQRPSLIPLAYLGLTAIYLAVWVMVPKSRAEAPLLLQGLGAALRNMPVTGLYYLQGLTYPVQALMWPLIKPTGLGPEAAVIVLAVVTLGGLAALFAVARRLDALVIGLGWFLIGISPMWPTLNADYTLNGPRLHYLPAIGATLVWGSAVALLWQGLAQTPGKNWKGRFAAGAVFVAALVPGLVFLYNMAGVITTGAQITADVAHMAAAAPPGQSLLVVNFPSWIGQRETTFPLGAEGISFLPGYSSMRDLVRLNTRRDMDITSVTFTNTIREWKYDQRLGGLVNWNKLAKAIRAAGRVWTVEYLPERLQLNEAGAVRPAGPEKAVQPAQAILDGRLGVRLANMTRQGNDLQIELAWTTVMTVDRQLTGFVHVYDAQGKLVGQQDGYPLLGLYPPWMAQPGQEVRDVRRVRLPAGLADGHYSVGVGVYDAETGQRVPATGPSGNHFENDVYLITGFDVPRK